MTRLQSECIIVQLLDPRLVANNFTTWKQMCRLGLFKYIYIVCQAISRKSSQKSRYRTAYYSDFVCSKVSAHCGHMVTIERA